MDAKDVIDIQITVASLEVADELAEALLAAGYPRTPVTADVRHRRPHTRALPDDPSGWGKRLYCSADPGRPTNVHVRVDGSPGQRFALLLVDWLTANPGRGRIIWRSSGGRRARDTEATEPWFPDAYRRAWEWADTTGWRPADQAGG